MELKKMTPFLKWAGGKNQLLNKLHEKMPQQYNRYFEPFIGGGSLLLYECPSKVIISDINEQLINTYFQLKKNSSTLIEEVRKLEKERCDKEYYLRIREAYNEKIQKNELDVESAALMIWLNKHCFNGLYRVNSKGFFNVPYNNKVRGSSIDETNLLNIGEYLKNNNVEILCEDFQEICKNVREGDFVYFDSPYIPFPETSTFTDYTKNGFSLEDHKRLASVFKELDKKGAFLMLSNHNTEEVYGLYSEFYIEEIEVRRSINRDASKRIGQEVIITNYK